MSRHILPVLLILAFSPLAWAQGGEAVQTVELSAPGVSFATNPATGSLAVVTGSDDQVLLYPPPLGDPRPSSAPPAKPLVQKVGPEAVAIAYKPLEKGGCFVVLCPGDKTMHLLNGVTLEPLGKPIRLEGERPRGLAVAGGTAPYAFYVAGEGFEERAFRVHLATRSDEGKIQTGDDSSEIAVSADGTILYGRKTGVSPTGVRAWRILPPRRPGSPLQSVTLTSIHTTWPPYYPDAFGQFCAAGRNLYTADLSRSVAQLSSTPVCFFPDRPLLLGLEGGELTAFSYNTFKPLGTVSIGFLSSSNAAEGRPRPARTTRRDGPPARTFVLCDCRNDRVLVCGGSNVAVVPLKRFSIKPEPLLYVDVTSGSDLNLGRSTVLKITKRDSQARVELSSGPKGLKLAGDTLTWAPGPGDVGTHTIVLRVFAGEAERRQELTLQVRRNCVELPFAPSDMCLSPDGKSVLLHGHGSNGDSDRRFRDPSQATDTNLALVDTATLRVTAKRTLAANVHIAAIDSKFVYAALRDSDAFYVLSGKDLSDVKRVFTTGRISQLVAVADAYVVVTTESGGLSRFKLPDLTPDGAATPRPGARFNPVNPSLPIAVGGGWYDRGVLYDSTLQKAWLLTAPEGFLTLGKPQEYRDFPGDYRHRSAPVAPWGAILQGNAIHRAAGGSIGQISGQAAIILPDAPVVACLSPHASRGQSEAREARVRVEIVLRDLVSAAALDPIVLSDEPPSRNSRQDDDYDFYGDSAHARLAAVPGVLVARVRDRLYVLPTGALGLDRVPVPLHFELRQDTLVIDSAGPTTFSAACRGGKQPVQFSLRTELRGLDVDAKTGKVTIDPAPLTTAAIEQILSVLQRDLDSRRAPDGEAASSPQQALDRYARTLAPPFAAITGRQPKGVPVFLPISLTARDSEQQAANFDGGVFLDVPSDVILHKIKKLQDEQRAEMEKAQAAREAAMKQAAAQEAAWEAARRQAGATAGPADVVALRQRIAELEKRNQQLETQVQLLKELLSGRGSGLPGKPAPETRPAGSPAIP